MIYYNQSKPIAMMTFGEFVESLKEALENEAIFSKKADEENIVSSGNYVHGLKGICTLFGCSKVTAQKYKDGILKPAVMQYGKKIVVDANLAMKLFNETKGVRA